MWILPLDTHNEVGKTFNPDRCRLALLSSSDCSAKHSTNGTQIPRAPQDVTEDEVIRTLESIDCQTATNRDFLGLVGGSRLVFGALMNADAPCDWYDIEILASFDAAASMTGLGVP
jgi:hypothetical protein